VSTASIAAILRRPFPRRGSSRLDRVEIDILSGADGWLPGFDLSIARGIDAPDAILEHKSSAPQFVGGSSEPFRHSVEFSGETILEPPPTEDDQLPPEMHYWIVIEPWECEEVHWLEISTPESVSTAARVNSGEWASLDSERALRTAVRATPLGSSEIRIVRGR